VGAGFEFLPTGTAQRLTHKDFLLFLSKNFLSLFINFLVETVITRLANNKASTVLF